MDESELLQKVIILEVSYIKEMGLKVGSQESDDLFPFGWETKGAYYRFAVLIEAIAEHKRIEECMAYYPLIEEGVVTSRDQILQCENGHRTIDFCSVGIERCPRCGGLLKVWTENKFDFHKTGVRVAGYFYETAGQIGCVFFRDGEEICTLRSSADSNPEIDRVELTCNGNLFYSEFDTESTLFPGIFRSVQNKEDGKEIFRLILADDCLYEDGFRYTIDIKGSMQIKVREEQDSVSFWNEDEIIAYTVIEENWNQDYPQMAGIDISRQIVTYFEKEINETVTMAILAVPALDYEA